jgi:hypothetical protein
MYRLVRHADLESHELRLRVEPPGLRAYAFTFVSAPATGDEPHAPDAPEPRAERLAPEEPTP